MDARIQTGDVVIDLTQNAKLVVLREYEHQRAGDFRVNGPVTADEYKVHPLLGVSPDDRMFECCYLKDELATPSGTYDFPESRLARIPVEAASEDAMRPQERIRLEVLSSLFGVAFGMPGDPDNDDEPALATLEVVMSKAVGETVTNQALEYASAGRVGTAETSDD